MNLQTELKLIEKIENQFDYIIKNIDLNNLQLTIKQLINQIELIKTIKNENLQIDTIDIIIFEYSKLIGYLQISNPKIDNIELIQTEIELSFSKIIFEIDCN